MEITWPDGAAQQFTNLPADQLFTITQADEPRSSRPQEAQTSFKHYALRSTQAAPQLFTASPSPPEAAHRERPFDDFAQQPLLPWKLSQLGPGLAGSDVDGDGDDDYYLGGGAGQAGQLFLSAGTGSFSRASIPAFEADAACEDMGALFFDADGDGDADLYVVSGSYEFGPGDAALADRLYRNDGKGRFTKAPPGTLAEDRASGSVVCAADFDRDSDLDLFVGGRVLQGRFPLAPPSRLLRNDGGKFIDTTAEFAPALVNAGMVTGAVWSDADGDGWPDLLVTTEWGPVKFFRNAGGKLEDRTAAAGLAAFAGFWNSIAAGDFDHDGDLDYACGNLGLNTRYEAPPGQPLLAYYGDFADRGQGLFVEATAERGTLFPARGYHDTVQAMPLVQQKFPTFEAFARATLTDIYPQKRLQQSLQFKATTLESGVLWNDGQGRFTFKPLPRLAQISPVFGLAVLDANGDGHPDLALAQNFFGPQRETGRMDGGVALLLLGNGEGGFTALPPAQSGLLAPGDGKSLTVADLDGDGQPDLLFAENNGPLRAFTKTPEASQPRFLQVTLAGSRGNPTAVGARITLELSGGQRRTVEVCAGSGYLSQSPAAVWFTAPAGATLEHIRVRWPDGADTEHPAQTGWLQTGRARLARP